MHGNFAHQAKMLLTCWVPGQRDACCPIGIILYPFKRPLSACDISLEVNDTIQSLVCTTSMIGRDSPLSIAAACVPDALCKRLIRVSFPEVLSVSDDTSAHACIESTDLTQRVLSAIAQKDSCPDGA